MFCFFAEFPAGILQGLFFDKNHPNYLNYGAIGFVMGHEVTHGFDDQGSQFDKNGNLLNWWEQETSETYSQKTRCIVDQYGNQTVKNIDLNVITLYYIFSHQLFIVSNKTALRSTALIPRAKMLPITVVLKRLIWLTIDLKRSLELSPPYPDCRIRRNRCFGLPLEMFGVQKQGRKSWGDPSLRMNTVLANFVSTYLCQIVRNLQKTSTVLLVHPWIQWISALYGKTNLVAGMILRIRFFMQNEIFIYKKIIKHSKLSLSKTIDLVYML